MSLSIVFNEVTFSFNGRSVTDICRKLSFRICPSSIVGIVGPSGAGKTTLLRMIAGMTSPKAGEIRIDGLNPLQARKQGRLAYAPQRGALCTWMTALGNVELSLRLHGNDGDLRQPAKELLKGFGLERDSSKYPQELSGGMQQRVILAMALGANRPLILLDEPFASLDSQTRYSIHSYLLGEWESLSPKPTIILVSHDISEALYLCDKVFVVRQKPFSTLLEISVPLPRPRVPSMRYELPFLDTLKQIEEVFENV